MGHRDPDEAFFARIGHRFSDDGLLATALSHPSHAFEVDGSRGNERLEFLGDAVLDLVVARLLFEAHPDWGEGHLTRARAALVNTGFLAERARALELDRYVRLGRTEQRTGGAQKDSILANCFEAVVGALYLDAGLEAAFALARRAFADALSSGESVLERDAKTRLQEWAHADRAETPRYRAIADSGVENAEDRFEVEVELAGESLGFGTGRTKRAAEQAAAAAALRRIDADDE